jgi:hypothetical protein
MANEEEIGYTTVALATPATPFVCCGRIMVRLNEYRRNIDFLTHLVNNVENSTTPENVMRICKAAEKFIDDKIELDQSLENIVDEAIITDVDDDNQDYDAMKSFFVRETSFVDYLLFSQIKRVGDILFDLKYDKNPLCKTIYTELLFKIVYPSREQVLSSPV